MPVLLARGRLKHEDHAFETSLGYIVSARLARAKTAQKKEKF
jgi:hypothetical protein